MNLLRSRNPSRHTASWRARPTVVHAPSPNSYISPTRYTIPNFTLLILLVCNNTKQQYAQAFLSFTMQEFMRALRARPTAGPVNQVLWEAKQVQWGAPTRAGMCPPRTPALLRGAGTTLKSAKTGEIEGSESLSSAGSGVTDDRLFVQCNACASRDQRTHQTDEDRCFHGC